MQIILFIKSESVLLLKASLTMFIMHLTEKNNSITFAEIKIKQIKKLIIFGKLVNDPDAKILNTFIAAKYGNKIIGIYFFIFLSSKIDLWR